ncbi:hypothetical protein MB27_31310 [Actinoplanes utahensis]|uniref:Uncharacterized protein n=1 Tax=Actinoplanes utahensis TaxID=1869 RepID=A0A0A6UD98_ACTUT|nr:hypothetical protein MB27_31310 [Actinoplanes utahensis]
MGVALALGAAMASPASAASAPSADPIVCIGDSFMSNTGSVGVGVMHFWDGRYGADGRQAYDGVLYPGEGTCSKWRWTTVQGIYVGSGYCVQAWHDGTRTPSDLPPGSHPIGKGKWDVKAYRGTC